MKQVVIETKKRESGKKSLNAVRAEGGIPAVVYGKQIEPFSIEVPARDFTKELSQHGENALFNLKVENESYTTMIAEIQREPLSKKIKHIDFHNVALDAVVEVTVPIHLEGDCRGVRAGGILEQVMWEIEISALPLSIPESIPVDISNLGIDSEIRVGDITLPEGMAMVSGADEIIAAVYVPKNEEAVAEDVLAEPTSEPEVIKKGKEEKE